MSEQQPNPPAWRATLPATHATLLDYFAAHAPIEVPSWFQFPRPDLLMVPITPSESALRASPKWEQMIPEQQQRAYDFLTSLMWGNDAPDTIDDAAEAAIFAHDMIVAATKAHDEAITHNEHAEREWQANRFFAWRWHYARVMCAWETKN